MQPYRSFLKEDMLGEVNAAVQRHRSVAEVISSCCAALTALEEFFSPQSEVSNFDSDRDSRRSSCIQAKIK